MTKHEIFRWTCTTVIVVALFVVNPWLRNKGAQNCASINKGRTEGNNRAYVLRHSLSVNATAREKSAREELKSEPRLAAIDLEAAQGYRALIPRVHDLPQVSC